MGTALKILFSGDGMGPSSTVNAGSKRKFQLRRTEIVSLINAFARYVCCWSYIVSRFQNHKVLQQTCLKNVNRSTDHPEKNSAVCSGHKA